MRRKNEKNKEHRLIIDEPVMYDYHDGRHFGNMGSWAKRLGEK